jgi:rare lipoprotein A
MRKLVMGCAVAGLIALSPKSEAGLPAPIVPLPLAAPRETCELGWASWYGEECDGNLTASGEVFDMNGLTAAHRTLPIGTTVQVTNLKNKKAILLRVNDRGPNLEGRLIDVSRAAAQRLGFLNAGLTRVEVKVMKYPRDYKEPLPRALGLN